jgi:hypothetical protein
MPIAPTRTPLTTAGGYADLETFVRSACGEKIGIAFAKPAADTAAATVHCVLIGLAPDLRSRNDRRQPMRIERRYLICASGGDALECLEALMFRALDQDALRLEADPPSIELWRALDLPPQPGFVLRVPVTYQRPIDRARPVRTVDLQLAPTATLRGRVVDTRGAPLPRAVVEIPSRDMTTTTARDGTFGFAGVSRGVAHEIRVTWRDKVFTVRPAGGAGFDEPLAVTVNFSAEED